MTALEQFQRLHFRRALAAIFLGGASILVFILDVVCWLPVQSPQLSGTNPSAFCHRYFSFKHWPLGLFGIDPSASHCKSFRLLIWTCTGHYHRHQALIWILWVSSVLKDLLNSSKSHSSKHWLKHPPWTVPSIPCFSALPYSQLIMDWMLYKLWAKIKVLSFNLWMLDILSQQWKSKWDKYLTDQLTFNSSQTTQPLRCAKGELPNKINGANMVTYTHDTLSVGKIFYQKAHFIRLNVTFFFEKTKPKTKSKLAFGKTKSQDILSENLHIARNLFCIRVILRFSMY